jgi:hypothetical protein
MRIKAGLTGAVVAAAVVAGGCDRPAMKTSKNASATEAASASVPAVGDAQPAGATQPHTSPSDAQPANAFLTIDGKLVEFPPARLRLTKTDEGVSAVLYSDDPPGSTGAGYKGNGFLFYIDLRTADPENMDGAEYFYKADDSEPSEARNGILLQGTRYQLQPQDVSIRFDADGRKVMAAVAGRFLVVRTMEESVPGQLATVQGTLYTTAEIIEQR